MSSIPSSSQPSPPPPAKPKRSRWKRRLLIFAAVLLVLLISAELVARFALGLGDPPLQAFDPEIGYFYRPSRTYHRFGNTIHYNAYSMRSDDFPPTKSDPAELRILFLGDSVINGGSLTDQRQIATSLIQQALRDRLHRPVTVGNISAWNWSPANLWPYVQRHGLFDADIVVLVLSSHDWMVEPIENARDSSAPEHPPLLALQEAVTVYLPRYVPFLRSSPPPPEPNPSPEESRQIALDCFRQIIRAARHRNACVFLALHQETDEIASGHPLPGHDALAAAARDQGATVIELGPAFAAALKSGQQLYRDNIHPTPAGQKLIADTLLPVLLDASQSLPVSRPTSP